MWSRWLVIWFINGSETGLNWIEYFCCDIHYSLCYLCSFSLMRLPSHVVICHCSVCAAQPVPRWTARRLCYSWAMGALGGAPAREVCIKWIWSWQRRYCEAETEQSAVRAQRMARLEHRMVSCHDYGFNSLSSFCVPFMHTAHLITGCDRG